MGMATESQFHVLAVDDSNIDRKLIEKLLRTSSYQVTTVDSGSKALEFLGLDGNEKINPNTTSVFDNNHHQELKVNLVITDYCMPGMTGYDLLKKIKESSSLRNIPVVIMSSENVPSRINRCLEEGAEEFFLKPVRLSDMNRLKPHIMRTKLKDQKEDNLENSEPQQQQKQQIIHNEQQQQHQQEQQCQPIIIEEEQQQQSLQQVMNMNMNMNSKRKTMEHEISPETDRTRTRYIGGGMTTTVDESLPSNFLEFQNVIPT